MITNNFIYLPDKLDTNDLPNTAGVRPFLSFSPPSPSSLCLLVGYKKRMRKSVIARLVIFADSTAPSMKRSKTSRLPRSFRNRAKQARLFFACGPLGPCRRASFDGHYLYDQSHRSLSLRAALHGGRTLAVTKDRRPRRESRAAPRRRPHYTRRTELLRYSVISLTLSKDSSRASGQHFLLTLSPIRFSLTRISINGPYTCLVRNKNVRRNLLALFCSRRYYHIYRLLSNVCRKRDA